ncbi:protein kinase domain-containing protein [Nocardia cyriacigeorgica]|uniref:protein kinase domain-containing protein n=1 Tax=Nocardia cyriacigeorgica TaxID=135487 RepID=UPI0018945AFB|nr:protein kinase [Nocardia cyriacigeorgica]
MVDGEPFGRYRLGRIIGEGGMGRVYEAFDTATERTVALKVLPEALAGNREFRERFRREAHAAARLSEPHIVPIHDYGEIDGRLFLDMRLIDGVDLATVLAERGPLTPERAVHVIEQVAAALDAAHAAGLVHRDVKPSNIVLGDRDFAYLIDFGIARDDSATAMTSVGTTLGTFAYMAPERFTPGQQTDARADLYSLACVLYECLTGARPFPGTVVAEQIAAHLTAEPPRPSRARDEVPAALDAVIARGMAKSAVQRYRSAGEFAVAARRALDPVGPVDASSGRQEAVSGGSVAPTVRASHATHEPVATREPGIGGLAVACLVVVCGLSSARLIAALASYGEPHPRSFPDYWLPVLVLAAVAALAVRALIVRRRSTVIVFACVLFVAAFPMALGDWPADVTADVLTVLGMSRALGLLIVFAAAAVLMGVGVAAGAPRRAVVPGPGGAGSGGGGTAMAYASWTQRVGAALLDGLPAGLLTGSGMGLMRASSPPPGESTGGGVAVMMLCYAALLAYLLWNVGFRQGRSGQTWGKQVVGISVVGAQTGRPLGVGTSVGRQLAHIVDALPCYLGFLFPLWDAKAQTLADKMIGSVVVRGAIAETMLPPGAGGIDISHTPSNHAVDAPHPAINPVPHAGAAELDPRMDTTRSAPSSAADSRHAVTEVAPHAAPADAGARVAGPWPDPGSAVPPRAEARTTATDSDPGPTSRTSTEVMIGAAALAVVAVVGVAVAVTQAESRSGRERMPAITSAIEVPAGAHDIALDPAGRKAYVRGNLGGPVSVIDTGTNTVVATIPVGPETGGVAVDPGRGTLYVTDRGERTVTLIDTGTHRDVATIPVGYDPQSVIVDPDSATIYVIGGSQVSIIDTGTRTVTATIPVDSSTRKAALDPGADTLYVVADQGLMIIDTRSNTVTGSLDIPTYDDYTSPLDVTVDPATHTVYVTAYGGNDSEDRSLSIIDPKTGALLAAPAADGNALDIAIDPSEHTVYIANYTDVQLIDTQTRTQIGSIELVAGQSAEDIAVDPTSHTVYVADGPSVQVISR